MQEVHQRNNNNIGWNATRIRNWRMAIILSFSFAFLCFLNVALSSTLDVLNIAVARQLRHNGVETRFIGILFTLTEQFHIRRGERKVTNTNISAQSDHEVQESTE